MKPNNYVKLSIRGVRRYADSDTLPQAPSCATCPLVPHDYDVSPIGEARLYVTTWIFLFADEVEGDAHRALVLAEAKLDAVSSEHGVPVSRFKVMTYRPSRLLLESVFEDESEAA
jgi:hypothetical protein